METIAFLAKRLFGTLALSVLIMTVSIMTIISYFWIICFILKLEQVVDKLG
ncbi:hypothetical protein [Paenibacillus donghaensis]|uniref:hypothetical protein n=1 Tax=Paenibacillus donghaensis TaxID=414771 RepID=UPI0012FD5BAD|nr:hypothetical protein [Paenibacillus donghaensis]